MQERSLFEYAVVRVVPRVEREEFINVGVVIYCKKEKYLQVKYTLNEDRLIQLYPGVDVEAVKQNLSSFERICKGSRDGGSIAELDAPSRFRWLTATRSTVIQTSKVHPGLCCSASETLEKLFKEQVL
ncbi:DUF3037 domain-containing protein [Desertivirga brevis]|uniref:DUF3037 domain-containing protein n=1 Tax=Desertivirga brevis TaxID=2810310 RepID=UPI001A95B14A|nr:DUF3037 domain-containing protein [Pedobacter sp. SYSU D00873]